MNDADLLDKRKNYTTSSSPLHLCIYIPFPRWHFILINHSIDKGINSENILPMQ